MSASRMVPVVEAVFQGFHRKRQGTLATLMAALITTGRAGIAALGRAIDARSRLKHRIKQVDRFLSNTGIEVDDWCEALTRAVIGPRKSIRIAIDWTMVGQWHVLVASAVVQRRGIPLYWATCDYRNYSRSQNAVEDAFLTRLRLMIPKDVEATLLFDRGFRRVSLVRHLRSLGFHFVVRCMDDILVVGQEFQGMLRDLPLPRRKVRDLGVVAATKRDPTDVRIVAVFDSGHKEAWHLFTDLDLPPEAIVKLYGRRFTIEEIFRDHKSTRYGWSLGEYRLKARLDRMDRLLLVVASAYFAVFLMGIAIEHKGLDRSFRANTVRHRTHSRFQLGWRGWRLLRWLPSTWLRLFGQLDFAFLEPKRPSVCAKQVTATQEDDLQCSIRRHESS